MSSNDSGKTLGAIVAVITIIGGIIGILTFATGKQNLPEMVSAATPTERQSSPVDTYVEPEPTTTPRLVDAPSGVSTPPGIYDPQGTVAAGQPIYVDDLLLSVNQSSVTAEGQYLVVKVTIENMSDSQKTIRFLGNSISLSDDMGNTYPYHLGDCQQTDLFMVKQYTLRSGEEVSIRSHFLYFPMEWCGDQYQQFIPTFVGPIDIQADKLYLTFTDFGPFSGFTVEIDL